MKYRGIAWVKIAKDNLILLSLLCLSGNPVLSYLYISVDYILVSAMLIFIILLFLEGKSFFTVPFCFVSTFFGIILLVQCFSFSFFPIITILGFFTRLIIGYTAYKLIDNFPHRYVKIIYLLSIFSFLFYLPQQFGLSLGFDFSSLFNPILEILDKQLVFRKTIIFHTFMFHPVLLYKNAGIFWEPGAFAGYLIIGIVFLGIIRKSLDKRIYLRYLVVLSVALFTTMSTMGYIVYPLALFSHYEWQLGYIKTNIGRILLGVYIIIPLALILFTFNYYNVSFLKEKVDKQLRAVEYREGRWHATRFGSIAFDWEYIKRRPITGWGLHPKTRYMLHPWVGDSEGMGNGISDFTAKFGIAGMLIFGITFFRGIMYVTNRQLYKSLLVILIIFLVLQGETFLNFPLFLGLMFLDRSKQSNKASNFLPVPIRSIGRF